MAKNEQWATFQVSYRNDKKPRDINSEAARLRRKVDDLMLERELKKLDKEVWEDDKANSELV